MYEKDREKYFVVDDHIHFWHAGPDNRNKYGKMSIDCFYGYHSSLSPEEFLWDEEK